MMSPSKLSRLSAAKSAAAMIPPGAGGDSCPAPGYENVRQQQRAKSAGSVATDYIVPG